MRYLLTSIVIFALDLASKAAAVSLLGPVGEFDSIVLIPNLLDLNYVENTGVAFGLLRDLDSSARLLLLAGTALIASVAIVWYLWRLPEGMRSAKWALAIVLGGILGNSYDRITKGYVVDFIDLHLFAYHWPTFNLADAAITAGALLLTLSAIRKEPEARG